MKLRLCQWLCLTLIATGLMIQPVLTAQAEDKTVDGHKIYNIWPGKAPGETVELPPESDVTKETDGKPGGKRVIRITNVSTPQITIYAPKNPAPNATAVVICPGGGHRILAYDHEGTEVAEWLSSIGVYGIVLKYRVPAREEVLRYKAAVQDAERAVSFTRAHAKDWGIDPVKIGILGFSAGGETACRTALFGNNKIYDPVDETDKSSSRPDFAVLIYPAYLDVKGEAKLKDDIIVNKDTPPMFFAHAFDDPWSINASLLMGVELKKNNIPCEIHVYSHGGHGFGIRDIGKPAATWNNRCEEWMRAMKYIN
jgi:acetyl esterase/lipase